ncbi:MAG: hypothetical protein JWM39_367 [Parcubacteria group bacterium]|nr:hypothetical protein [Parcubacteria group bacterium]
MSYDLTIYKSKLGRPEAEEVFQMMDAEEQAIVQGTYSEMATSIPCSSILEKMEQEFPMSTTISSEDKIDINLAYGSLGKDAEQMFVRLNGYLKQMAECGGYYVFDSQTGEAFDPKVTDFGGTRMYSHGTRVLHDVVQGHSRSIKSRI